VRKVKSFDAAKSRGYEGREEGAAGWRYRCRGGRRYWWQAKTALRRAAIVWDDGRTAKSPRPRSPKLSRPARSSRLSSAIRMVTSKRRSPARPRKLSGVRLSLPEPCLHGADGTPPHAIPRTSGGVGSDAGRRSLVRGGTRSLGTAAESAKSTSSISRGGFGRRGAFQDYVHQAVRIAKEMPGYADQAALVARGRHGPGRYHPVMQCKLVGALDKDNNLTGLHMRLSGNRSLPAYVRPSWNSRRDATR